MVLQEVEVSQITKCSEFFHTLYSALLCRSILLESSFAFQVPFQVHKKINSLLTSPKCCGKWS